MILYEYEGKKLLQDGGILVPNSQLIDSSSFLQGDNLQILKPFGVAQGGQDRIGNRVVLKAQVLSGKRADVGGIVMVNEPEAISSQLADLFGKTIKGERVKKVLIEEKIEIEREFYLSISYDSDYRSPVLSISEAGGTGVEERGAKIYPIDILTQSVTLNPSAAPRNDISGISKEVLDKVIKLFFAEDCLLLEINPLVLTKDGQWVALDAKIKLDDDAKSKHTDWNYEPRLPAGRTPTQNEIEAKKIDENDYRGTAGAAYFDLEGDIAILSSGGGISLTAMDALITAGGKPANFTEYSGNPPREKVVKLTKIVLNKSEIHGLWVIGTMAANFTDIYETLSGLVDGLREAQKELQIAFDFPIVIRRGGPRAREAFEMLREVKDFNLILQGEEVSISLSAKVMAQMAKEYAGKV